MICLRRVVFLLLFTVWAPLAAQAAEYVKNPNAYYKPIPRNGYELSRKLFASEAEVATFRNLPAEVQSFLNFERFFNDRLNHKDFDTINENQVPEAGRPESGTVLKLWSVEIPVEELFMLGSREESQQPQQQLFVERDGKKYFKFLIHPFSFHMYWERLKKYKWSFDYLAVPTASYRSMIAWRAEDPDHPLYVKLSLDVNVGGFTRHIFLYDVLKSPIITGIMKNLTPEVKSTFQFDYIPETLAVIPEGMRSGGMIIRDTTAIQNHTLIPLFALFSKKYKSAESNKSHHETFLGSMMAVSNKPPQIFVEETFVRPLIKMALFFRFILGMNSQLHEQNVLFCYDCFMAGEPRFFIRDSEQFYIDFPGKVTLENNAQPGMPYFTEPPYVSRNIISDGVPETVGEIATYIRDSTLFALQRGLVKDYPQITAKWMNQTFSRVLREEMVPYLHERPRDLGRAKKLMKAYFNLEGELPKPPCVELLR